MLGTIILYNWVVWTLKEVLISELQLMISMETAVHVWWNPSQERTIQNTLILYTTVPLVILLINQVWGLYALVPKGIMDSGLYGVLNTKSLQRNRGEASWTFVYTLEVAIVFSWHPQFKVFMKMYRMCPILPFGIVPYAHFFWSTSFETAVYIIWTTYVFGCSEIEYSLTRKVSQVVLQTILKTSTALKTTLQMAFCI